MTLLQGLFAPRNASLEMPQTPITATALVEWLNGEPLDAGVAVTPSSAPRMSAVYRCVAVTSGVASATPLHAYRRGTRAKVDSGLLDDPHPEMTDLELWRLAYAHRLLWGDSFLQKIHPAGARGVVTELWPISPWRVQDIRINRELGVKEFDVVDDDGELQTLTTLDILHIPGLGFDGIRGRSVISYAAQSIGLSLAAEKSAASFFGRGAQMSGVLETDEDLDQPRADRLKERWQAKVGGLHNAHEVAVLDNGAKFKTLTMPWRDAQLLESRQFGVFDIARFFGVPLFLLFETTKSTSWGTGLEQQAGGWVKFDLGPQWLSPTERRVTKELLAPIRQYARYAMEGLLRGDSKARAEFYRIMREVGGLNADEIRDLEDREPIPGGAGQIYLQPANMLPLGTQPATANPGPAEPDDGEPPLEPDDEPPADPAGDDDEDEEQTNS